MSASTPAGRVSDETPGVKIDKCHRGNAQDEDISQLTACRVSTGQGVDPQESTKSTAVSEQVATRAHGTHAGPKNTEKRRPSATGFRSILEWQATGVPVEWVSAKAAPDGLRREERETSLGYMETDTMAEVMTCTLEWMRRIESMGSTPTKIVAFERGNGQMRYYQIPKRWVRRPYASSKGPGRYRSADEWLHEGVRVQRALGDFPMFERETAISFIETEPLMEVNTCDRAWQRRLENDGARPESIQVYDGAAAEFRWYLTPRSWSKLPAKAGRR